MIAFHDNVAGENNCKNKTTCQEEKILFLECIYYILNAPHQPITGPSVVIVYIFISVPSYQLTTLPSTFGIAKQTYL